LKITSRHISDKESIHNSKHFTPTIFVDTLQGCDHITEGVAIGECPLCSQTTTGYTRGVPTPRLCEKRERSAMWQSSVATVYRRGHTGDE